jgi:hypothetical protein
MKKYRTVHSVHALMFGEEKMLPPGTIFTAEEAGLGKSSVDDLIQKGAIETL